MMRVQSSTFDVFLLIFSAFFSAPALAHLRPQQCGVHRVTGRLACNVAGSKDPECMLRVFEETASEFSIAFERLPAAYRYFDGHEIQTTIDLKSIDNPYEGTALDAVPTRAPALVTDDAFRLIAQKPCRESRPR